MNWEVDGQKKFGFSCDTLALPEVDSFSSTKPYVQFWQEDFGHRLDNVGLFGIGHSMDKPYTGG